MSRTTTADVLTHAAESLEVLLRFAASSPGFFPADTVAAAEADLAAARERAAELHGFPPPLPASAPPARTPYAAAAILIAAAIALAGTARFAQAFTHRAATVAAPLAIAAPPRGQVPPGWGKIGLSPEQKSAIYKTRAEFKTKRAALEEQMAKLKADERTALLEHLNDAQRQILATAAAGPAAAKIAPKPQK